MGEEMRSKNAHILVIPFSVQGHINPMIQFSIRMASKGLKVTLVITTSLSKSIQSQVPDSINIAHISDGYDNEKPENMKAYFDRFEIVFPKNLSKLVENLSDSDSPVSVIVYDSFMPCVLDTAHSLGIKGASFFTQSAAVCAIYRHMQQGILKLPLENNSVVTLPSLPVMGSFDIPSFLIDMDSYPPLLRLAELQSSYFDKVDWLLFNTFDKLENEVVKWMASQWRIKTIGPAVPSIFLDKRLEENKEYGLSLFKAEVESCMNWLDTKETGSVVYVSFGSMADLGEDQMEEVAMGLMKSSHYFIWVVRASETSKLPSDFTIRNDERVLVVNWCPQLEVLAHRAVGCFVTHCGWNSTLEALSLGVPMVVFPQWTDQTTNAKYIVDVWGVGVRVKVDEMGVVRREEIEMCVGKVMEGEIGKEIRKNVDMWKELAKEAVDEGGSSDKNIEDFISELKHEIGL